MPSSALRAPAPILGSSPSTGEGNNSFSAFSRAIRYGRRCPKEDEGLFAGMTGLKNLLNAVWQFFRPRHGDDVVAGIDVVDFAGHAAGQGRQQIKAGATHLFQE